MKKVILALCFLIGMSTLNAQTKEELKALQKEKNDSIGVLKGKADAIQAEIDALPGWRLKATGTIGGSISGFNNWYSKESPNSRLVETEGSIWKFPQTDIGMWIIFIKEGRVIWKCLIRQESGILLRLIWKEVSSPILQILQKN